MADIGLFGPLISAGVDFQIAKKTASQARKEAERNRQFQERMSSTAIQRQVEDYRAAGLNPLLAAGAGGSSSPAGNVAQFDNSAANNALSNATRFRASEEDRDLAKKMADSQYMLMREQAGAAKAQNEKGVADAELSRTQTAATRQTMEFALASQPSLLRQAIAQAEITAAGVPASRNKAALEEFIGGNAFLQAMRNKYDIAPTLGRAAMNLGPRALRVTTDAADRASRGVSDAFKRTIGKSIDADNKRQQR